MKQLLILLLLPLVALVWFLSAGVFAQEDHDHDHESAIQMELSDHDDAGADENHEGHDHEELTADEGHEGHDHEEEEEFLIELSPEAITLAGITIARIARGKIGRSIELSGEIGLNEDRLVHVAPRFAGIALEVYYRVGDYVHKGDVLAIIDSNESMSPYEIRAAMSGRIIKRHIAPGEFVSEQTSIYVIADLSQVWALLAVYPQHMSLVEPGQRVSISTIGSDAVAEGVVDYVTPVLDVQTRSVVARVILANSGNTWRPGTFIRAEIMQTGLEEGLVAREAAVQILDENQVVFIPDGPGRFRPVEVVTGDSDGRFIRILSGLEEDTEYVAAGAFELKAQLVTSNLGGHAGHGH
ncbi:MAG: efflux RND transporter periplasmic adaptor subunit [bacterium]